MNISQLKGFAMKKQIVKIVFVTALTGAFIVASTTATFADNDGTVPAFFAGAWIGIAGVNGHDVPFRLEISGSGDAVRGAFVNGKERSASSSGSYSEGICLAS
jgi:hypothetical protein